MSDEEIVKNFTELQVSVNGLKQNVHKLEDRQDEYGELLATMQVFKNEQERMKDDIGDIKSSVREIAEKPAKHWETLITGILSAIVGAFLMWLSSGLPG